MLDGYGYTFISSLVYPYYTTSFHLYFADLSIPSFSGISLHPPLSVPPPIEVSPICPVLVSHDHIPYKNYNTIILIVFTVQYFLRVWIKEGGGDRNEIQ